MKSSNEHSIIFTTISKGIAREWKFSSVSQILRERCMSNDMSDEDVVKDIVVCGRKCEETTLYKFIKALKGVYLVQGGEREACSR